MSDMRFPSEASLISFAETGGHRETSKFELEDGDTKEQEPWDSLWEQPESLLCAQNSPVINSIFA